MVDHSTLWERAADALSKIGGFLLAIVALWGIARGIPRLVNHGKLIAELVDERDERRRAEKAARDYREAAERSAETAETYQKLYNAMHDESTQLRSEMATERSERAVLREQVTTAFLFLVDVIAHFKEQGDFNSMPTIPDSLQDGIANAMADRARKLREAPKSEPGFPAAPEGGRD